MSSITVDRVPEADRVRGIRPDPVVLDEMHGVTPEMMEAVAGQFTRRTISDVRLMAMSTPNRNGDAFSEDIMNQMMQGSSDQQDAAAAAVNNFTRASIRQESFASRVLPPLVPLDGYWIAWSPEHGAAHITVNNEAIFVDPYQREPGEGITPQAIPNLRFADERTARLYCHTRQDVSLQPARLLGVCYLVRLTMPVENYDPCYLVSITPDEAYWVRNPEIASQLRGEQHGRSSMLFSDHNAAQAIALIAQYLRPMYGRTEMETQPGTTVTPFLYTEAIRVEIPRTRQVWIDPSDGQPSRTVTSVVDVAVPAPKPSREFVPPQDRVIDLNGSEG